MGITFQRPTAGTAFTRSNVQARNTDNLNYSRCQMAIAMYPFSGNRTFSSISSGGTITYNDSWPLVYRTMTEVWNGSTTKTTVFEKNFCSGAVGHTDVTITGSTPGGDYYSTSNTVTPTSITSSGPSGSYSATLTDLADWEEATLATEALLDTMSFPTEPTGTSVFEIGSGVGPFNQISFSHKIPRSGGTTSDWFPAASFKYLIACGACGRGMPYREPLESTGFAQKYQDSIYEGGVTLTGGTYTTFGYCVSYKSRWKIFGNFNASSPPNNNNDHQNVYMVTFDLSGSNFNPSAVLLPSPLILSTPASATIPQPIQRATYQFTPADFLANAGGKLHGELGFRSVKISPP